MKIFRILPLVELAIALLLLAGACARYGDHADQWSATYTHRSSR